MTVLQSALAHSLKLTAVAMALHADAEGGRIFPSIGRLARLTGKGERAVRKDVTTMCTIGVLEPLTDRRGGKGRSTTYRLNLKALKPGTPIPGIRHPNPDPAFRVTDDKPGTDVPETRNSETQTRIFGSPNPDLQAPRSFIDHSLDLPKKRTAPAARFSDLANEPSEDQLQVITKVALDVLTKQPSLDEWSLPDAVKAACAREHSDYVRKVSPRVLHHACTIAFRERRRA